MHLNYRLVEVNDTTEWLPIGIAIPHEHEVAVFTIGHGRMRRIAVPTLEQLASSHLWAENLRWGPIGQCTHEHATDPKRLLAELVLKTDLSPRDLVFEDLIKRGATMEEIARFKEPVAHSPQEALIALKRGNSRYFSGRPSVQNMSPIERRSQTMAQTPFAVVVGCSDSRVPVEIVFDQGPGNLFIIRVAGNVMGSSTMGSIEYGVRHLKSHVVVVLGHEGCGAVAAALQPEALRNTEPDNIRGLLNRIVPAVETLPRIRDRKSLMREAVVANVRQQVHVLKQNPVVRQGIDSGKIIVAGAFYSISSGAVDFYESEEDLALDIPSKAAAAAAH